MKPKAKKTAAKAVLRKATAMAWEQTPDERYMLRLYVTGMTPNSVRAVRNLKALCEEYLQGQYDLEIIDVYKQPALAKNEQIVAAPTLVKRMPLPLRRLIGDLSQRDRVLLGLDLVPKT